MVLRPPAPGPPRPGRRVRPARRRGRLQLPPVGPALAPCPHPRFGPRDVPAPGRRTKGAAAAGDAWVHPPPPTRKRPPRVSRRPRAALRLETTPQVLRHPRRALRGASRGGAGGGRRTDNGPGSRPGAAHGGRLRWQPDASFERHGPRGRAPARRCRGPEVQRAPLRRHASLARWRPAGGRRGRSPRLARRRVPARLRSRPARRLPLVGRRPKGSRLGRARDRRDRRAGARIPPAGRRP